MNVHGRRRVFFPGVCFPSFPSLLVVRSLSDGAISHIAATRDFRNYEEKKGKEAMIAAHEHPCVCVCVRVHVRVPLPVEVTVTALLAALVTARLSSGCCSASCLRDEELQRVTCT